MGPTSKPFFTKFIMQYVLASYHPLPVVVSRAEGVFVWDLEGNRHYDFLAAYSAVNQGIIVNASKTF